MSTLLIYFLRTITNNSFFFFLFFYYLIGAAVTTTVKPTTTPKATKPKTKKPTTEAGLDCLEQRAAFAANDLPVEPTFTNGCNFAAKQCNQEKCFCVKKTGVRAFGKVEVPLGQDYDCASK